LYFVMVSISTVGYGDLAPSSNGSKAFTIFFCLIGIVFIFSELSQLVGNATHPFYDFVKRKLDRRFPPQTIDLNGDGSADVIIPGAAPIYYMKNMLAPGMVLMVLQVVSAFVFTHLEDWTLGDALYHCIITATTVGYGDIKIATDAGRLWACFHLMLSVCLLAALISEVGALQESRRLMLEKSARIKRQVNRELILSLDKDGNGLDKFEFVIGMLIKLEMVPEEDVQTFIDTFEHLDEDGSGVLNVKELNKLVDKWQKQLGLQTGRKQQSQMLQRGDSSRTLDSFEKHTFPDPLSSPASSGGRSDFGPPLAPPVGLGATAPPTELPQAKIASRSLMSEPPLPGAPSQDLDGAP